MSAPHRIRLQAAWTRAAGGMAWTRSFGRPTGVVTGDRVWLVIDRPGVCAVTFNGRSLPGVPGGEAAWRHDVTADLRVCNEVRLECAGPAGSGAAAERVTLPESLGTVALEIESVG